MRQAAGADLQLQFAIDTLENFGLIRSDDFLMFDTDKNGFISPKDDLGQMANRLLDFANVSGMDDLKRHLMVRGNKVLANYYLDLYKQRTSNVMGCDTTGQYLLKMGYLGVASQEIINAILGQITAIADPCDRRQAVEALGLLSPQDVKPQDLQKKMIPLCEVLASFELDLKRKGRTWTDNENLKVPQACVNTLVSLRMNTTDPRTIEFLDSEIDRLKEIRKGKTKIDSSEPPIQEIFSGMGMGEIIYNID